MALVRCGKLLWPDPRRVMPVTSLSGNARNQINGSGHRYAHQFMVPESGTCTQVGILINSAASAQTLRAGLYTVDANGQPTTTLYGGSNYGTFTPAASTYSTITLGTQATMTRGDVVALQFSWDSTVGDVILGFAERDAGVYEGGLPSTEKFNGSAWTPSSAGGGLLAHLYYSTAGVGVVDIGTLPYTGITQSVSYTVDSTPDEYALKLTVPFACRVAGIWSADVPFNTNRDGRYRLYSGTTSLASVTLDGDTINGSSGIEQRGIYAYFATPYELAANTTVRAAVANQSTGNWGHYFLNLYGSGGGGAIGLPSDACQSIRTDAGSWTDEATKLPAIGLIIDQLSDGAGEGGGTVYIPSSGSPGVWST
jgi:hypothetical protein